MAPSIVSLDQSSFIYKADTLSEASSTNAPGTPPPVDEGSSHTDNVPNFKIQQKHISSYADGNTHEYYAAEHVISWLPLDDQPADTLKDNACLTAPLPRLMTKAQRLPEPSLSSSPWHHRSSKFSCWPAPQAIWPTTFRIPVLVDKQRRRHNPEPADRERPKQRRSSFPATNTDYWSSLVSGDLDRLSQSNPTAIARAATATDAAEARRHSSPCTSARQHLSPELMQRIDDYFSSSSSSNNNSSSSSQPTNNRLASITMTDIQHMGKGIPLHQLRSETNKLYTVELSPGRHEVFYMSDYTQGCETNSGEKGGATCKSGGGGNVVPKKGDLVIVEADRGQDLGKLVGIFSELSEAKIPSTTCVRRLYRLATPAEIATLPAKAEDEAKALLVCQAKIREKELPMEVISAEYQWDRRKLTFLFRAEARVDFRELVRELFKLYKTRIWMCAATATNNNK
ncbi:PSP1 C-terminal conserved region-domain-containing protein [Dichotomocladium elegans]|nr:PSP1 C-terminal conserved region-domain-containing protein [Dichotomocladium elegans]